MTALVLSYPPSINSLYRSVGGRSILSERYRKWRAVAEQEVMVQRPRKHTGPVAVSVELCPPDKRRRDIDNTGFKAILDLLVTMRVIEADDSRIVKEIKAVWVDEGDPCRVEIKPI